MCGIAGVISTAPTTEILTVTKRMVSSLKHRGPDGNSAVIVDGGGQSRVALGHTRLAIIDLTETGLQPMKDEATGNWVVFNGEIYNFRDVRRALELLGRDFFSNSDTEVLLKAYEQWGIAFLERLRGMFAFALWDNPAQRFVLAVDRLGIKPLYYYKDHDGLFLFASELRALLATGFVSRKIDPGGLESYLAYGAVQAPLTIINGARCLLPGRYMVVHKDGKVEEPREYWRPPFAESIGLSSREEPDLVRDLRSLLEESLRYHLVSDVPVGVFLSGGIDSSSLVALVSQITSERPLTFSVTFSEEDFSEARYSRLIAQMYRTQHMEIRLTEDRLMELLPDALEAMDQPTVDGVNVYVISKVVRQAGLKAILSGQGGDEILAGYSTFRRVKTCERYKPLIEKIPGFVRGRMGDLLRKTFPAGSIGRKVSELMQMDAGPLCAYLILRSLFLSPDLKILLNGHSELQLQKGLPQAVAAELEDMARQLDPVNQVSLFELRTYLANMLLKDGDVMSMAHGLEVRVPFLDHKLVEFAARIPGSLKLDRNLPKPLLLKAMGDLLPRAVYERPKAGFTFPWEHWLRGQLRPRITEVLESREIGHRIGLNAAFSQALWRNFIKAAPGSAWSRVWGLFVLYRWCERHGAAS